MFQLQVTENSTQDDLNYKDKYYFFFKKDFIYLFLERGREGEREGKKYECMIAS